MIKPKLLQKGDLIAIAAPSSPFSKDEFLKGVKKIKELGFEVTFRNDIFYASGYLAGTDKRRSEELNGFFADKNVKAIFFARGGYGSQRILHMLDLEPLKLAPKAIVGYSDITPILSMMTNAGIGGAFYGPTVAKHYGEGCKTTFDIVVSSLTEPSEGKVICSKGAKVLKRGKAEGMLVGGCISLISSSVGTHYDLKTEGTILFLEDVGEALFRYDRLLTHLKNSGKLHDVKGIIFGSLGLLRSESKQKLKVMIKECLANFPGPIVTDFPSGHFGMKELFVTLPLGATVKLDTDPLELQVLEGNIL